MYLGMERPKKEKTNLVGNKAYKQLEHGKSKEEGAVQEM